MSISVSGSGSNTQNVHVPVDLSQEVDQDEDVGIRELVPWKTRSLYANTIFQDAKSKGLMAPPIDSNVFKEHLEPLLTIENIHNGTIYLRESSDYNGISLYVFINKECVRFKTNLVSGDSTLLHTYTPQSGRVPIEIHSLKELLIELNDQFKGNTKFSLDASWRILKFSDNGEMSYKRLEDYLI